MQLYSNCATLNAGGTCYLYTNPALSTLASAGKYSNGTDCFTVNASGLITAVNSCVAATTITVNYTDNLACTGNYLLITKNGSTVVNYNSTNTGTTFTANNGDIIAVTSAIGSGKVGCNVVYLDILDTVLGVIYSQDNIGTGANLSTSFTIGVNTSGNVTITSDVGAL